MKRLISALWMASLLASGTAWAQAFPPNEAGVTMGHWHLNSRDVEASRKIFVALGGTSIKAGNFETVRFPGVVVYLNQAAGAPPANGGTVGSIVNHVGFIVQNVQESVAKWKAAGVQVLPGGNGRTDQAFVETADGLRVEILEDKNQRFPIQHHHIHFNVPESVIPEIQAWYAKWFGATPGMRGANKAADIPGANLTFSAAAMPQVTTRGRVLDHIGFDVKNLEAFCKKLEAAGIKLDRPYTKNAQTGTALAFIYDPWGTYIELNERPAPPASAEAPKRTPVVVTRIFTGPDGLTHAERIDVKLAPGETELSEMAKVTGMQIRRQAPNYFQDWHPAGRRQYVVTLSGHGEIELTGGVKIPLDAGHILLAEDVTGKGHISRGVGGEDRISLLIPLAEK